MGQGRRRREGSNENKVFVTWELSGCEVRGKGGEEDQEKVDVLGLVSTTMRDRHPWNSLNHLSLFLLSLL